MKDHNYYLAVSKSSAVKLRVSTRSLQEYIVEFPRQRFDWSLFILYFIYFFTIYGEIDSVTGLIGLKLSRSLFVVYSMLHEARA